MRRLARCIAEDCTGRWQIVFERDELHLYVEFSSDDQATNPLSPMTMEDFLVRLPRNQLHGTAHNSLVALIEKTLQEV